MGTQNGYAHCSSQSFFFPWLLHHIPVSQYNSRFLVALAAAQGNNKGPGKNPPGWTCDSRVATYNERARRENPGKPVVCDCGCGVWDTDCDVTTKTPQDLDYAFYVDITCPTEDGGREVRDGGVWACSYVEQGCVRGTSFFGLGSSWFWTFF